MTAPAAPMPNDAPALQRALLALLLAFLGLCAGAAAGARLVPEGSGLAGPAIALGYGAVAAVAGLAAGVVLAVRLGPGAFRRALRVAGVLAALAAAGVGYRIVAAQAGPAAPEAVPERPVTRPVAPAAQRYPFVAREDLPLGLGIARVTPVPGGVLRFYLEPTEGHAPGDYPPTDSVTFGPGLPSVDIATAPPWLVPEHLKMDYELFDLRALTLTPDWVEVVGNTTTGQTWWVARADVAFVAWPEFLLGVAAVETFDADANPVRYRPSDEAGVLSASWAPLPPRAVHGDWLRVATLNLADRIPPSGWVRWRDGGRLLVTYAPFE